jgi:hypothetical protein
MLFNILIVVTISVLSYIYGYNIKQIQTKKNIKKLIKHHIDSFELLSKTELFKSFFIKRINNIVYFNINGSFIVLYIKDDFRYITLYSDSSFSKILFTPYIDDIYGYTTENESKIINNLLTFYKDDIYNTTIIGDIEVDIKYGKEYTKTLINTLNKISMENNMSIHIDTNENLNYIEHIDTLSIQEKIDLILDQIQEKGIDSLSSEQKGFLEKNS